jgi:hypothetical protein
MTWVALVFLMAVFSVFLVAFLVAVFVVKAAVVTSSILGVIDGILAVTMKQVYGNLFPTGKI